MFISLIILNILSFFIFLFGIGLITVDNPIYSVCFLILIFLFSSFFLIIWNLYYIAFTYLIIYIGAIATLFLFVIIILDIQKIKLTEKYYSKNLPLAILLGVFFFIFLYSFLPTLNILDSLNIIIFNKYNYPEIMSFFNIKIENLFKDISHIQTIGLGLYTYNFSLLILIGEILLLSIIGPIILTSGSDNKNKY